MRGRTASTRQIPSLQLAPPALNSANMVREMTQCFYDEVTNMFPQMRAALAKGDLGKVGRLPTGFRQRICDAIAAARQIAGRDFAR
jgi:hypothetical protein